jgi:hypothetical protein
VYGPRATTSRKEDAEKATVEVVYKPRSGRPGEQSAVEDSAANQAGVERLACVPLRTLVKLLEGQGFPDALPAGERERDCEHLIRRTVEGVVHCALFPRTQISVIIQVFGLGKP